MTPPKTAAVGLCQRCDQPVYPGQEDIVPVVTGGAGQAADILLHRGNCQAPGEPPRRHN